MYGGLHARFRMYIAPFLADLSLAWITAPGMAVYAASNCGNMMSLSFRGRPSQGLPLMDPEDYNPVLGRPPAS